MELRLYDTLTREKRVFTPIDASNVRMYVCGPTVYDFAHIGNARPVIVFDVLFRLLRHIYGDSHVTYVRNITDVDDKINDRALRDYPGLPLNEAIRKVTEKTADQFQADVKALGCLAPTVEPRATEFVLPRSDGKTDMVTLIKELIARGHAYEAEGEVLFDTQSMPDYGALSGRKLEDQQAGARVAVDAHKKHPTDFVLWKQSSPEEPGWDSPWGRGRPGWHIECSAMSAAYLGTTFDIHGGGLDLIFPHHENEIAQSRCAHGTHAMANYWMHNGFVQVEGEKMSKSSGNFRTIADLLSDWQGQVVRYQMLMTHYRQPLDWTESTSREAQLVVDRWYDFLQGVGDIGVGDQVDAGLVRALSEDLNTHEALARLSVLFEKAKNDPASLGVFVGSARLLGFLGQSPEEYYSFYEEVAELVPRSSPLIVKELKKVRDEVRANRDFEKSDYIRNIIYLYGYRVYDGQNGQSDLIPATRDFTSVSANTKGKLSKVVRIAMRDALIDPDELAFDTGFRGKFGRVFSYSPEFNDAFIEAYTDLDKEIGAGLVTDEDLRSAIVDVVLSNLAVPAKFGPDVVASAILLKLFSGVVKNYDVFFDNSVVLPPAGMQWSIGDVSILDSEVLAEAVEGAKDSLKEIVMRNTNSSSVFRVKIESSSTAYRHRSLSLVRAFITANRLLLNLVENSRNNHMPPLGAVEVGIEGGVTNTLRFARSSDESFIVPGEKFRNAYRLSEQFTSEARNLPLFARLEGVLSLRMFGPAMRELFALDRMCRARVSDDPFARLLWNVEAVETFCSEDEVSNLSLRELLDVRLTDVGLGSKDLKSILKQAERFSRLRRRPGFVSVADARQSQYFAESVVTILLSSEKSSSEMD